jgi:hypothetical protein
MTYPSTLDWSSVQVLRWKGFQLGIKDIWAIAHLGIE